MRCASLMASMCSPAIAAATTRAPRSSRMTTSRRWSRTSAGPGSIVPPTASPKSLRPARTCSCGPPSAGPTSEPSPRAWCDCWTATAPPSCRPPSARRSSATCRIPMPSASPSNAGANSVARCRRSPSSCPPTCRRATRRCGHTRWKPTISSRTSPMNSPESLRARAEALHLHGLLAHWPEAATSGWVAPLLEWEERERRRRSLERRLKDAHIGRFKPLCDFHWDWPKRCDRAAIEALMALDFLADATNVVLVGPNGVGKSTLAQNIAHQALIAGHTVLFTSAGQLLGDLCALDSDSALRRRLRHYARPQLLVIDEVGYLSYSNRHADLMFELVSRRYQTRSTLITTNRPRAPVVNLRPPPLPASQPPDPHKSPVRRVARGIPQCCLRRLADRSPDPQRRDRRHRGRVLPPQGSA